MATGKYLSLEEARQQGLLKRFANEHPNEGDEKLFDRLLNAMTKTPPSGPKTSKAEPSGD
jgi:hypothetical protein